jgi:hypothetical protein
MLRFCWIALLLVFPASALAQAHPVQACSSDALDPTFQALETADHNYTVAINLRNISTETCWVSNYPGGTGMDFHPAPEVKGVSICYYCETGSQKPPEVHIILNPSESAHQTRSWKTAPTDSIAKCGYVTQMNWDKVYEYAADGRFWLLSRSLLKPICSASIVVSSYSAGQFLSETLGADVPSSLSPIISWASDAIAPLSREHIPLRVTVEEPNHSLLVDQNSCPRMFLRARDATPGRVITYRWTRVQELQDVTCKQETVGAVKRVTIDFDASSVLIQNNDENKGEYTLDVSSLAEIEGRYLLVGRTQALHLSMVAGKFIRRNWGPAVHGVAVSLNLDKDAYSLGSEIPLHIGLENIDSSDPIAAMDPYYDPPGVGVELLDSAGTPIRPESDTLWSGHGFCHGYPTGLLFPIELTLSKMGFRLMNPGVYTVQAVWQPLLSDSCFIVMKLPLPAHLTVKSPSVTFRVVESLPVPSQPENQRQ